jgi:hypothetical protein
MPEIRRNRFAHVADHSTGKVMDKRRLRLLAKCNPAGCRFVHDDACRDDACVDIDHLTVEPLVDPPAEPEHSRAWRRAIVTAVLPPAHPGQPWWAEFHTCDGRGQFPLHERAVAVLGIGGAMTAALEREVFIDDPSGLPTLYPIPDDDDQLAGGVAPGYAIDPAPAWGLQPSDPCPCWSRQDFGQCCGKVGPMVAGIR